MFAAVYAIPDDETLRLIEEIEANVEGRSSDPGVARIPVLGNKSPRDVLKEPGGERKVRIWLEGFEHNERKMAAADGREPVDLGFLWKAIGLQRDGAGSAS